MHAATGLSLVCCTLMNIGISVCHVPTASGLIPVLRSMGIHLSWSAPPLTSTDMKLLLGVGSVPLTMSQSGILPEVGSVPPTMGRSVFGVFFKGFCLWTGSAPPAYYRAFTIFSWKPGIVVMSDNTF